MTERVHHPPALIYSTGTQVVALRTIYGQGGRLLHPSGAVGVVVKSPGDLDHSYRVRFPDGVEEALRRDEIVLLAKYKEGALTDSEAAPARAELFDRVLLTGIHLMRTGVVEANLPRLNESARLPYIDELIACKIGGPEKGLLDQADLAFHEREHQRLVAELEQAAAESTLPEQASALPALNDLLVRIRLQEQTANGERPA